jgi:hypothetical protein
MGSSFFRERDDMAPYRRKERGITFFGLVLTLALIGFFCLLILKIGPIYYEHFKVKASLDALRSEPNLASKSQEEILSMLTKRFDVNMVEHVSAEDIKISRDDGRTQIRIAYQVTEELLGNLSVLVTFDDTVEAGTR